MPPNIDNSGAAARKPVRILVAEDSPLNQQVALMQLEKLGYIADAVANGAQVLEAIKRTDYDIILMDCKMPEMSGYEATWQIREREKQQAKQTGTARHVYIIAMTANAAVDNREKCLAAGMDDFIDKPVQLPELEAALHRGLADRATQQAIEEVIDPVVVAGLRQLRMPDKPDPLAELIDLFMQEAPRDLAAIEQAVVKNDISSLARIIEAASSLKGSATNLGARNLAALCDEIEQTARNWSLADVRPLLQRASEELAKAGEALNKIKSSSAERV